MQIMGRAPGLLAFVAFSLVSANIAVALPFEIELRPADRPQWRNDGSGTMTITPSYPSSLPIVATTPATYDLRNVSGHNYMTPVKNQKSVGSCWAFATCAAMESEILVSGGATYDFSENNLKNRHGFDWGPDQGGNYNMSAAYFSRLSGPGLEIDDPYDNSKTVPPGAPTTIPRHRFLTASNTYDTQAEIKAAVMAKGALGTNMYYEDASYNSSTKMYQYTGSSTPTNHAVTIAGWDDSKSAWLIKNSWGAGWGNGGYFWLSYNDTVGGKNATSFETAAADTVDTVYGHDTYGHVSDVSYSGTLITACNVFTTTAEDMLKSVAFYTTEDNETYDVKVYGSWNDTAPSGQLAELSGTMVNKGYHVLNLAELIPLGANDDFVVSLALSSEWNPIDCAQANYSSQSFASAGESYFQYGSYWYDLTTSGGTPTGNFCIKAYGVAVPEPGTAILLILGVLGFAGFIRRPKKSA